MKRKIVAGILLTLLLISMLTLAFNVRPAKAETYSGSITITPMFPTIDDEVYVTVSFWLSSISIIVEFGSLSQIGNEFFVDINIYIPSILLWMIGSASETYSLGKLPEGSYSFMATVREWRELPDGSWWSWPLGPYWYGESFTVFSIAVIATVDVDPDALNLRSMDEWVTAHIELPESYNVNDINISTIRLNDTFPVSLLVNPPLSVPTEIGDYDSDNVPDLMVKFNRTEVASWIYNDLGIQYGNVTLTITGNLTDGTVFEGSDTIKVLFPGDVDDDGDVDGVDYFLFTGAYGTNLSDAVYNWAADFNEDESIDGEDYYILTGNYGKTAI